jgi:hypothetical protein
MRMLNTPENLLTMRNRSPKSRFSSGILPAMRRALGLSGNTVVTAEERESKIVLTPAVVIETETYSDADVAIWDEDVTVR